MIFCRASNCIPLQYHCSLDSHSAHTRLPLSLGIDFAFLCVSFHNNASFNMNHRYRADSTEPRARHDSPQAFLPILSSPSEVITCRWCHKQFTESMEELLARGEYHRCGSPMCSAQEGEPTHECSYYCSETCALWQSNSLPDGIPNMLDSTWYDLPYIPSISRSSAPSPETTSDDNEADCASSSDEKEAELDGHELVQNEQEVNAGSERASIRVKILKKAAEIPLLTPPSYSSSFFLHQRGESANLTRASTSSSIAESSGTNEPVTRPSLDIFDLDDSSELEASQHNKSDGQKSTTIESN
jgi:hypothetical protein